MVMTSDQKGISCDICGVEYRDRFVYFSCRMDKVTVDTSRSHSAITDLDKRNLDVDICDKCYHDIESKMRSVIDRREKELDKIRKNKGQQWSMKDGSVRS